MVSYTMRPYTPIAAGTHSEMYEASTRDNSLSVNQNLAKMLFGDDKFSIESIAVVHSYNAGLVCRNNNIYKCSNDQRKSVFSYYNTGYSYSVGGDGRKYADITSKYTNIFKQLLYYPEK